MSERIKEDLPENEVELLLPFYVNGTLDETDRQKVESWLETDPQAGAHLARVNEECDLTRADAETRGVPPRRVLDSLMAEIGEAPGGIRPEGWVERVWAVLSPRYALAGAAALALVVALQAGYIVYTGQQAPAQFQSTTSKAAAFSGPTALVVFSADVDMGTVSARLFELGLVIVDGPRQGGAFIVGAPDSEAGRAALADLGGASDLVGYFQLQLQK
jgi:anti-sigma factor RsiW